MKLCGFRGKHIDKITYVVLSQGHGPFCGTLSTCHLRLWNTKVIRDITSCLKGGRPPLLPNPGTTKVLSCKYHGYTNVHLLRACFRNDFLLFGMCLCEGSSHLGNIQTQPQVLAHIRSEKSTARMHVDHCHHAAGHVRLSLSKLRGVGYIFKKDSWFPGLEER